MRTRSVVLSLLAVTVGVATACGSPGASSPAGAKRAADPVTAQAAGKYADWPAYHGSWYRGGYASTMPKVTGRPVVRKQIKLDGQVYASPLIIKGVTIVATENNTVYAFGPTYRLLWKRHLGTPSPASQRPCGNIDPLGITGTPVYDGSHNSIFVATEYSGAPPRHELVSLSLTSGGVRWHKSIDFPGVDATVMQERGALTISGGRVYVPFGGLAGDCGNYKGRIVGLSRANGGFAVTYTVPTAREAGMWTPPGLSVAPGGDLLAAVGNGASGVGDPYDHSDSVLRVSQTGQLRDYFSPTNWASENANDVDLGSQGPTLIDGWVFQAGKSGTAYVLARNHLGHIGGQVSKATICRSFGGTAVSAHVVYVPCTDGVRAVHIGSKGHMTVLWRAPSSVVGSPVLGGGRAWALDGSGLLHSLDLRTGRSLATANVGPTSRFATPAIYGRLMVVPTLGGITVVQTS